MKKIIFVLIFALSLNFLKSQQIEKLEYCNCQDKIEQTSPQLNGAFERTCNGILIEKGEFISGMKNGEWQTNSRKGKLIRKLNYKNGVLDGPVELFFNNGKPKLIAKFENGNKTGNWIYYTEKGKILSQGTYENNKPIGTWIINDKNGKKPVVEYDYNSNKYLINTSTPKHKDGDIIQNENTEEFYILHVPPAINFNSKTQPLGGFDFANYMFDELVEVPEVFWDTYIYNRYKFTFDITPQNSVTFKSEKLQNTSDDNKNDLTFLITTNPEEKLKQIKHSEIEMELLKFKIDEAISFMQPWIYDGNSNVDFYVHYDINQNMN